MELISIILPVYNGEKTIRETITSVLNQTYKNFELIIINDGSRDATLDMIYTIQDFRIKVFSYDNTGVSASRNRGISHATGKYISFIDADDLWTPDKLESQLNALEENPEAAVAYSWNDCIDETGKFLRRGSHIVANGNVYKQLLLLDFIGNGSSVLIRRQALKLVGGFNQSLSFAEDWDLWLRLALNYHFVVIPRTQIFYRVSPSSASSNVWKMETSCLEVIERAFATASQTLQYLKKYSIANIYKYLTFKALEEPLQQKSGLVALRFFFQVIKYEPNMLLSPVTLKVLFKSGVVSLFTPQKAQALLAKFTSLVNTTTLLGYIKTDIS